MGERSCSGGGSSWGATAAVATQIQLRYMIVGAQDSAHHTIERDDIRVGARLHELALLRKAAGGGRRCERSNVLQYISATAVNPTD